MIQSDRCDTHLILPSFQWRREIQPQVHLSLPLGFAEHQEELSQTVRYCIQDILELQATVLEMKNTSIDRLRLSNMQASIESRLAFEEEACQTLGPVAECCRIALLITCYLSFTETWINPLIPCKLSALLWMRLHDAVDSSVWSQRRDLQTWLLLVGSYVTILNNGYVNGLAQKWDDLLTQVSHHFLPGQPLKTNRGHLHSALTGFIYTERLLNQRHSVRSWAHLESRLVRT